MRKFVFLLTLIVSAATIMAQSEMVAILPIVDRGMQVDYNTKLMLRSYISEAVTQTNGYEAYDASDLGETIDEFEFQRTGNLSAENIRIVGQKMGAQKLLITEISQIKSNKVFITVRLFNASTAYMEKTANITTKTDMNSMKIGAGQLIENILIVPGLVESANEIQEMQSTQQKQELSPVAKQETPTKSKSNNKAAQKGIVQKSNEGSKSEIQQDEKIIEEVVNRYEIERINSNVYRLNGKWYDKNEYYAFINDRNRCFPAYQEFQYGLKLQEYGKWTTVTGSGMVLLGTLILSIGLPVNYNHSSTWEDCMIAGSVFMGVGGGVVIAGGSTWIVGIKKNNDAYKQYNKYCADPITFNLLYKGNSLGLAVSF